jgi:hypothetical protein
MTIAKKIANIKFIANWMKKRPNNAKLIPRKMEKFLE